jgi:proline dehydrogenase
VLRRALLSVSRSERFERLISTAPVTRSVVARFVAGATVDDAIRASRELTRDNLLVTIDRLGEDTFELAQAEEATKAYVALLGRIGEAGLGRTTEVSMKLSAFGQALGGDGEKIALENARQVCAAAAEIGTTVTLDMEDHTTVDSTLGILAELRKDFPFVGAVLQAYLRRTEADCRDLATAGSRVRLCKGAYKEPESVAYQAKGDVDKAYVRALRILMQGEGYPMIASHDPRIIEIAGSLASEAGREKGSYEYQMLYGIRPEEQSRLAAAGEKMRVYVPYGDDWYGYFMRRLAERPANLTFFLRSLVTRK